MKRRVYLHAGQHKTGTSSIQVELTRARHLLAAHGFLYPQSGMPEWAPFGHHLLPWSLVGDDSLIPSVRGWHPGSLLADREAIWDSLIAEIETSDLPNVVISSEEFDILGRRDIEDLSRRLSSYDLVPIIFLRNLGDLVESGYRTAVMVSGFVHDVTHYAAHQRTRTDYLQLLQDWNSIASSGTMFAVSYDDEHLRQDVVLTFLRLLGLSANAIEPVRLPKQNESAPAFVVELIRHLRSLGEQEVAISAWANTLSGLNYRPGANERYALVPSELRAELDGRYIRELESITVQSTLASQVLGKLVVPHSQDQECVQGLVQALDALRRELGPDEVSP